MISRIRFQLCLVALVLASLLVPNSVALAATSYVVNDTGADCGSFVATYTDIQTAVNDAITNNVKTILVCPGAYEAFAVQLANKLTIKAALPGTFPTIHATPATSSGTIILVQISTSVVLDGLRFDGTNFDDTLSSSAYGIFWQNASGTVQNSSITRVRCFPDLCGSGFGIYALDDNGDGKQSALTVKNVNISDVDAAGIRVAGPVKLTVSGARIIGNFSGGAFGSGYGILFDQGEATGKVSDSTISRVTNGLVLEASKVTVSGNTISGTSNGVIVYGNCGQSASDNKIMGNTFTDMLDTGVLIATCGNADRNTVSSNRFSGAPGNVAGVHFDVDTGALADKNKISGNTIFGFADDIIEDPDATNTSISGNTRVP
jgi:hypothetical protein